MENVKIDKLEKKKVPELGFPQRVWYDYICKFGQNTKNDKQILLFFYFPKKFDVKAVVRIRFDAPFGWNRVKLKFNALRYGAIKS